MKMEEVKQGLNNAWETLADGWARLRESASGALTRFKPTEKHALPVPADVDDEYFPAAQWGFLAGNVFEDDKKMVVRLEMPGIEKDCLNLELHHDSLVVSGEKRFEQERSAGRYRTFQCAYGAFRRVVPLPATAVADQVKASYRNGILRVEIPKQQQARPKGFAVKVE